jgi:hypothetical protein
LKKTGVHAAHHLRDESGGIRVEPESVRELTLGQMFEGRVCSGCNNGWMSELEDSSKPILVDLIRGRRRIAQLDSDESLLVGRWAVKTAYTLNSSSNFPIKVPESHLRSLFEHRSRLPWAVAVVGAEVRFTDFAWFQSTVWMLCGPDNLTLNIAPLMNTRSYKIGLHFGGLILVTAWHSIPKWLMMFWSGVQTGVWPWKGECGWHSDPVGILDSNPPELSVCAHVSEIKLVHHRYLSKK